MKRFLILLLLLMFSWTGSTQNERGPDSFFIQALSSIREADRIFEAGNEPAALQSYLKAQNRLKTLSTLYPDWKKSLVGFRLRYVTEKVDAISHTVKPDSNTDSKQNNIQPVAPGSSEALKVQVERLTQQLLTLNSNNILLKAKLKEALVAQPTTVDSRVLSSARQRIGQLEKQVEQALNQEKQASVVVKESDAYRNLQVQVDATGKESLKQLRKIEDLEEKKENLESKISDYEAKQVAAKGYQKQNRKLAGKVADLERDLSKGEKRLAKVRKDLQGENAKLESRIRKLKSKDKDTASTAVIEEVEAFERQNGQLQAQIQELQNAATVVAVPTSGEAMQGGGVLQVRIDQLTTALNSAKSHSEVLQLRIDSLQRSLDGGDFIGSMAVVAKSVRTPSSESPNNEAASVLSDSLRELTRQNQGLQQTVQKLNQELNQIKSTASVSEAIGSPEGNEVPELQILKAKLAVFEARRVPYLSEELALMNQKEIKFDFFKKDDAGSSRVSGPAMPEGAELLAAEAEAAFNSNDIATAEAKYLEILKLDPENIGTLSDLGTIMLNQEKYEDAETYLRKALSIKADDGSSLNLLGIVKFKQGMLDDAISILSLAVASDSTNPEPYNYLGVALSQNGFREPAESALRKSVQLNPRYGLAHYHLAVVYATQKPPYLELARWHYEKSLSLGKPKVADLEKLLNPGE